MRSDDCLCNGYCVKFIGIEAWWVLAVYQGFYLGWARVALGGEEEYFFCHTDGILQSA